MNNYDINWTSQSKDSSESMPIGGKDTGCNVWVEEDNLYIYLQQGGWFDENNSLLKYGRIKISGSKTLFKNNFKQRNKFKKMIFPKLRNLCSKIIIRTCLVLMALWSKKVISEIQTLLSPKNNQIMKRSLKVQ